MKKCLHHWGDIYKVPSLDYKVLAFQVLTNSSIIKFGKHIWQSSPTKYSYLVLHIHFHANSFIFRYLTTFTQQMTNMNFVHIHRRVTNQVSSFQLISLLFEDSYTVQVINIHHICHYCNGHLSFTTMFVGGKPHPLFMYNHTTNIPPH